MAGENISFFDFLFNLFCDNSPEGRRKRALKEIRKFIQKHKYKFLNVKTEEALPALGKFIYKIYFTTNFSCKLLEGASKSETLKHTFIDQYIKEEDKKIIENIQPAAIEERLIKADNFDDEFKKIKDEIAYIHAVFKTNISSEINNSYRKFLVFYDFIRVDYYYILRRFSPFLQEDKFEFKPDFRSIPCLNIIDDLKTLLELMQNISVYNEWKDVFDPLMIFKNQNVIRSDDWHKLMRLINNVNNSGILLYIIRYISKNPTYESMIKLPRFELTQYFSEKLTTQAEIAANKVKASIKENKTAKLISAAFKNEPITPMSYYDETNNTAFIKKMLGGFTRIKTMSYLKTFINNYTRREIFPIINFLIINGKWKTETSKILSDSIERLTDIARKITEFDQNLAPDSGTGLKLVTLLKKTSMDTLGKNLVRTMLAEINSNAVDLEKETYNAMLPFIKELKKIFDDFEHEKNSELFINKKELISAYQLTGNLTERIRDIYMRTGNFILLLKMES